MSQPTMDRQTASFLPYLRDLESVSLTEPELERLYTLTDWRVVLLDERIAATYQKFSSISLFKALALPYLVSITSERALARTLEEREALRTLCGFLPNRTPTRATFWHFRDKYSAVYPGLMLRVLISLVLSGSEPNFALPFAMPILETASTPNGHCATFQLDVYRPPIEVWTTPSSNESQLLISAAGKTWLELRQQLQQYRVHGQQERSLQKRGLANGLGLPAEIRTTLHDGRIVRFGIDKPEWLDARLGTDTLTTVGPASFRPYAACNVLVIKEHEARRQVLLSRRLAGYGKGTYVLPGGKQLQDESLEECAARELREETGIRILRSRPVSLHRTRLPDKPQVFSVGVWAEEYEGKPEQREPSQNTEWRWYSLDGLPTPLFEPTRIAIAHFNDEKYPNLQWSDVEAQVPKHWERAKPPDFFEKLFPDRDT